MKYSNKETMLYSPKRSNHANKRTRHQAHLLNLYFQVDWNLIYRTILELMGPVVMDHATIVEKRVILCTTVLIKQMIPIHKLGHRHNQNFSHEYCHKECLM